MHLEGSLVAENDACLPGNDAKRKIGGSSTRGSVDDVAPVTKYSEIVPLKQFVRGGKAN